MTLRDRLKRRQQFIRKLRRFFEQRDVVEVDTPLMGVATSTDPHIQSFSVCEPLSPQSVQRSGYLQTSPEFYMKRLLAAGSGSIYQIAKAFRAGEKGRLHSPEFTLLEWYRLYFDHHELMEEVAQLMCALLGAQCKTWDKVTYKALFTRYLSLNPHSSEKAALLKCAEDKGVDIAVMQDLSTSGCLDFLFSFFIQPKLTGLTFVYNYPASLAMLSRLSVDAKDAGDTPVACRFELFMQGIELGNGFYELTDADEQRRRFENDNAERMKQGLPCVPMDEAFLACLGENFPACAGVAVGLDRLMMLAFDAEDISFFLL